MRSVNVNTRILKNTVAAIMILCVLAVAAFAVSKTAENAHDEDVVMLSELPDEELMTVIGQYDLTDISRYLGDLNDPDTLTHLREMFSYLENKPNAWMTRSEVGVHLAMKCASEIVSDYYGYKVDPSTGLVSVPTVSADGEYNPYVKGSIIHQ